VEVPLLPKLRGYFAEFLNHSYLVRLGILYLTTCVGLGYGPCVNSLEAFLGSIGSPNSPQRLCITSRTYVRPGFAWISSYRLAPAHPFGWYGYLPASPHRLTTTNPGPTQPMVVCCPQRGQRSATFWVVSRVDSSRARTHGYGNINPLSIDYACRPRLRSRLTLGGLAWPRNPWSFGGQGSHLPYRYSCLHSHSPHLHHTITRWLHW
jgi:hypothetical protein